MNTQSRIARLLVALTMCCVALVFMSMSTAPASASPDATGKLPVHVKLNAKLLDTQVKVNAKARVHGRLAVALPISVGVTARGLQLLVVQQLKAGVWVDVNTGHCRPNATFKLSISFSLAAQYTLRVYHPPTILVAGAESEAFVLAVVA